MVCDYCDTHSDNINLCSDCDAIICFSCTVYDQDGYGLG
jgi:hypothetical protein